MVRRDIDRRRRALLHTVAATCGLSESNETTASPTLADGRSVWGSLMSAPGDEPGDDVAFVVFPDGGTTAVARHRSTERVFEGTASAAIQYAVDAGEAADVGTRIALAPGTYELDRPVTLAASTWLAGCGSATTLRATAGLDADLVTVPAGAEHVRLSDFRIDGNRAENDRGDGVVVVGYGWRTVVEHLVVRNGANHGIRFTGGPDGEYSYEPTLTDVDVARCAGTGFVFGHTGDLLGVNLYAEACGRHGFTMADAGGTLVHPHAYDTRGEAGMRVLESAKDLRLFGAHFERNRRHGALIKGRRITVGNALIHNNSRDAPGSYAGLVLDRARDVTVSGSTFVNDDDWERTQGYGVVETTDSRDNRITGNLFRHNVSASVDRETESTSLYRHNSGYQTENGGEATVGNGETIHHGLDEHPHQYWVESTAPGVYAHVVDVDDASICVEALRVETGRPVTAPIDVVWRAKAY